MTRRSGWFGLPIAALLIGAPIDRADAQLVSFGLMAGGSLSTFTGKDVQDVKNYAGFIGGAFVRIGAMGFAVQPGIFYTTKGAKASDLTGANTSTTKLDYIQVPVVIRLSLPMHLYVGAGLAVGFKLGCSVSINGGVYTGAGSACADATTTTPGPKSTEFSGIGEGGINIGKFSIGARADVGISNAIEAINSNNAENANFRTRTISLVAAIRF